MPTYLQKKQIVGEKQTATQKLILGTDMSERAQKHRIVAGVSCPPLILKLTACIETESDLQEKQMDGEKKTAKQKLILGTHTSEGEQNYLMIAEVALPTVDNEAEAAQYDEERGEVGGFGAATGRVQVMS